MWHERKGLGRQLLLEVMAVAGLLHLRHVLLGPVHFVGSEKPLMAAQIRRMLALGGLMATDRAPESMPVLSRGKHRSPRKGACFMEMASVLANESWSDRPSCTHPLLADLARLVNDNTSDRNRGELAVLIPSVVGLRGGDLQWMVELTSAVALHAIPNVPEPSQRALAVALIRCHELAASVGPDVDEAVDRVPGAMAWARKLAGGSRITEKQFSKRTAPTVMRCAVQGLMVAATSEVDVDARLRQLLRVAIATAERLESPAVAPSTPSVSRGRSMSAAGARQ